MYRAWHAQAPDFALREGLAEIAVAEAAHARALDGLIGLVSLSPYLDRAGAIVTDTNGGQPAGQPWSSALMVAFSLDQAATACLTALTYTHLSSLVRVSESIVLDEQQHQRFVLDIFKELSDQHPAIGLRLATEMLVARDWVREVFPRRTELERLVEAGLLRNDGPKAHDTCLASLGDRIQDALGVLGC